MDDWRGLAILALCVETQAMDRVLSQECTVERERHRRQGAETSDIYLRIYELAHFGLFDALLWRVKIVEMISATIRSTRVMEVLRTQRTQVDRVSQKIQFYLKALICSIPPPNFSALQIEG